MRAVDWYLPQYGVLTRHHLPPPEQVQDGRTYRIPYDFPGVVANGTAQNFTAPGMPFLIWAMTFGITNGTGAGFQFSAYHRHGSFQRNLEPTMITSGNALGTSQLPMFLRSPYLIDTGEVLGFELRSLEQTNTVDIEIVVWGANLNHIPAGPVPK